jgi:hypothetical protein
MSLAGDYSGGVCSMPWMLDIPVGHALAVAKILECVNGKSIRVSSLPLEDDQEKMELMFALHAWGALRTLPDDKNHVKKKQKTPKALKVGVQEAVKKKDASKQKMNGGSKGKQSNGKKRKLGAK